MAVNRVSSAKGKILDLTNTAVTIGTATAGNSSASVAFTSTTYTTGGPTLSYVATSNPGSITGEASTSPVTVSGLTNGTAYTFTVTAKNPSGFSTAGPSAASNSVTPTLPGVYNQIATVTATGSSNTISFTSIPSTYKHLQLRFHARCSSGAITDCYVKFNSDTGSNYTQHWLYALDSGGPYIVAQASRAPFSMGYIQGYDTYPMTGGILDIFDYSSTSKRKVTRYSVGTPEQQTASQGALIIGSSLWNNTNAITSIDITLASSNFSALSTFSLYGIEG